MCSSDLIACNSNMMSVIGKAKTASRGDLATEMAASPNIIPIAPSRDKWLVSVPADEFHNGEEPNSQGSARTI